MFPSFLEAFIKDFRLFNQELRAISVWRLFIIKTAPFRASLLIGIGFYAFFLGSIFRLSRLQLLIILFFAGLCFSLFRIESFISCLYFSLSWIYLPLGLKDSAILLLYKVLWLAPAQWRLLTAFALLRTRKRHLFIWRLRVWTHLRAWSILKRETELVEVLDHATDLFEADCLSFVHWWLVIVLKHMGNPDYY